MAAPLLLIRRVASQWSWVEMLVNLAFNWVPRPLTTAIIAMEIPAAIRPYSIAVAPELSFKKRRTSLCIGRFQCCPIPHIDGKFIRDRPFTLLVRLSYFYLNCR